MPTMIRLPGKGKKIAWNILGKPANLSFKPSEKQLLLNKQLLYQQLTRAK
jgi:hypothetical protein